MSNSFKSTDLSGQTRPAIPSERWTSGEWWFVGLVILFILVMTSLPYAYAYLSAPAGKTFMGIMLDVPDHAQYFSWMRDLSTQNLVSNKMTPEANSPLFFNLLWWFLGRVGSLLGVNYEVMFQVLRITATVAFLLLVYRFCRWFFKETLMRKTAFLLVCFTSGLGWILVVIKYATGGDLLLPLTVYVAEGNTFLGILGYPHFIAAAIYVYIFDLVLKGQVKNQLRYAVGAGVFAQFLGWQHAYDLVSIYAVLLAYAVLLTLRDRKLPVYMIKSGIIVGVISVWPAFYSVWLTSFDPVWKGVLKQFANAGVYTPNLIQLPLLFGVVYLLAIFTVIRSNPLKLIKYDDPTLFVTGWFLVTFLLIYLPVDYQIHLLNGWQVPMAILSTIGLFRYVIPWLTPKLSKIRFSNGSKNLRPNRIIQMAVVGLLLVVIPTNLYLWAWRFIDLSRHSYPYYLTNNELQAMQWLEENAKPDDVVISSLTIGQYIPALTGTHAYLAHWAQTLDFFGKSRKVDTFYSNGSTKSTIEEILRAGNVKYVFLGPVEQELGKAALDEYSMLKPVYSDPLVKIYQVEW